MKPTRSNSEPRAGRSTLMVAALALALPLAACSDSAVSGPDGGDESPGSVSFFVGNPGQASASITPATRASFSGSQPPVQPEQIASLEIVVNAIEALRAGGNGSATTTPRWVTIELDPPVTIDPVTLDAGEVEVMAVTDDLPQGDYELVRLIPESMTIQFQTSSSTTPLVVGNHEFAPAPAEHPVERPGGNDKGILIPTAHFTVDDGGGVLLIMWDVSASAASIITTGSGMILIRPTFVEGGEDEENALEE